MQIFSTSAPTVGRPAAAPAESDGSRAESAGDFGSVLNTMEETDSPATDSQRDEQAETVEAEDHATADETEDSEQDPPLVGPPGSLPEARTGQPGGLQASAAEKVRRVSDTGHDIAPRTGREDGSGDMPGTLPDKFAAATPLTGANSRSVAESSLVGRAMPAVLRTYEPRELAQSAHDFPTIPLRGEPASEPTTSNPLAAGHPIRQTAASIEILMRHPDKQVEISLNPEELGRVRMALSRTENGMTVAIMADRPETLDLMRRHIDQLTAELHRLGYTDIGFSFGSDTQHGQSKENRHRQDTGFAAVPADNPQSALVFNRPVTDGLDLRL